MSKIVKAANAAVHVSKKISEFRVIAQQLIDYGNKNALVWDAAADTELDDAGLTMSAAEISNVIGSADQMLNGLNNLAVTQGDHAGNFIKLTDPIV